MTIREIINEKGAQVVSIWPEHSLTDVIQRCEEHHISSVVVSEHDGQAVGIVTDRDALRALARHGVRAMQMRVTEVMRSPAPICGLDDSVTDILHRMTWDRMRHMVVVDGLHIVGIVSIGDLVKSRLRDADLESRVLRDRALSRIAAE